MTLLGLILLTANLFAQSPIRNDIVTCSGGIFGKTQDLNVVQGKALDGFDYSFYSATQSGWQVIVSGFDGEIRGLTFTLTYRIPGSHVITASGDDHVVLTIDDSSVECIPYN